MNYILGPCPCTLGGRWPTRGSSHQRTIGNYSILVIAVVLLLFLLLLLLLSIFSANQTSLFEEEEKAKQKNNHTRGGGVVRPINKRDNILSSIHCDIQNFREIHIAGLFFTFNFGNSIWIILYFDAIPLRYGGVIIYSACGANFLIDWNP